MSGFALDMSKFVAKAGKNADQVVRQTASNLFLTIMGGTPADTGRARGAWMADINKFSTTVPTHIRSEAEVTAEIETTVARYNAGDLITFSNNVDYIDKLEYGLFPWANSAKVVNHFSTQAPSGFVALNVMKFQAFVNKATRGLK